MAKEVEVTDDLIIDKWKELLNSFHEIIKNDPSVTKVKEDLRALQLKAKNSHMTARQCAGIFDRCENYLNGSYGKHLSHLSN